MHARDAAVNVQQVNNLNVHHRGNSEDSLSNTSSLATSSSMSSSSSSSMSNGAKRMRLNQTNFDLDDTCSNDAFIFKTQNDFNVAKQQLEQQQLVHQQQVVQQLEQEQMLQNKIINTGIASNGLK